MKICTSISNVSASGRKTADDASNDSGGVNQMSLFNGVSKDEVRALWDTIIIPPPRRESHDATNEGEIDCTINAMVSSSKTVVIDENEERLLNDSGLKVLPSELQVPSFVVVPAKKEKEDITSYPRKMNNGNRRPRANNTVNTEGFNPEQAPPPPHEARWMTHTRPVAVVPAKVTSSMGGIGANKENVSNEKKNIYYFDPDEDPTRKWIGATNRKKV